MLRAGPEPWGLPPGDGELCDRLGSDRVSCLLREVRRQIDHCSLPRPVALPLGLFRGVTAPGAWRACGGGVMTGGPLGRPLCVLL